MFHIVYLLVMSFAEREIAVLGDFKEPLVLASCSMRMYAGIMSFMELRLTIFTIDTHTSKNCFFVIWLGERRNRIIQVVCLWRYECPNINHRQIYLRDHEVPRLNGSNP